MNPLPVNPLPNSQPGRGRAVFRLTEDPSRFRSGSWPPSLAAGGPRIVAIGGGHGQAKSLRAARRFAGSLTAVVSTADDGGSSGRLRRDFDIPAPGDLRKCLGALLPAPSPIGEALEHRFHGGRLDGHAFGNLLLAALLAVTGDLASAVAEACRVLSTVGEVLPATVGPVTLCAEADGAALEGQVRIMGARGITRITLEPASMAPPPRVFEAIAEADEIIIGPGSLFTSVLAALVPNGIAGAVSASRARRVYVCNLREQVPETSGYDVGRHVAALVAHGVTPDVVLADTASMALGDIPPGVEVVRVPLADPNGAAHDDLLLAHAFVTEFGRARRVGAPERKRAARSR